MKQNTKDWVQYMSAVALILSAIALAFLSFIITEDIGAGPLTYIGEALSAALGIFGISIYVVNRLDGIRSDLKREMTEMMGKITKIENDDRTHDDEP
ncbi:MAG: hypothetical protein IJK45_01300 [Bacteroidaceae bacterium]|nr:hypothetical protein [Bacteroidaceae bacterium]